MPVEPKERAPEPAPPAPRPVITGTWNVVEVVRGGDQLAAPAGGERAIIEFGASDGTAARLTGYGGVNGFGASYSFSLGEMNVGGMWIRGIMSTKRAGPPDRMAFESALFDVLERARTFTFDDASGRGGTIDAGGDSVRLRR